MFEVRGSRASQRGVVNRRGRRGHQVVDDLSRPRQRRHANTVMFDPRPTELPSTQPPTNRLPPDEEKARVPHGRLRQATREARTIPQRLPGRAPRIARAALVPHATVETLQVLFNEVLCRSMADLSMLMTDTPQGRYPYAGIPWYSTTFGRDGLITAMQMLWFDPASRGRAAPLALSGRRRRSRCRCPAGQDPPRDARRRDGALGEVPFAPLLRQRRFHAAVRALSGRYVERTGDLKTMTELWPDVEAALQWIDGQGDADGDGFLEYRRATDTASPIRAGRIHTTPSSTPMAALPGPDRAFRSAGLCL